MLNNLKNKIIEKVNKGEENSPFLFISENIELLNQKVNNFGFELLDSFGINKFNLYRLKDDGESIKVASIKDFLSKTYSKSSDKIQIFIIENISRLTLQAANSILKILEEPGIGNLIFLTNKSESAVLDTILSRVGIYDLKLKLTKNNNNFYIDLIRSYILKNDNNLISYFFKNKLEKQEYLDFLKTLIFLVKAGELKFSNELLDDLYDDLNLIETNNVITRNIIDKWILLLK